MPKWRRNVRATAPAATREAVSRALARSRTLRVSSNWYLSEPAMSAWPGRSCVTFGALGRLVIGSAGFSTSMMPVQFGLSRFWMTIASGLPSV